MEETKRKADTVRLQNFAYGHKTASVLLAAIELDLFSKVSEGAGTIEEIAGALDISVLNSHRLVAA